jgi:hypothetical protein
MPEMRGKEMSCNVHEMEMSLKTPLDRAIWEATRNIVVWRTDLSPGSAKLDYEKTRLLKMEIEEKIRREFEQDEELAVALDAVKGTDSEEIPARELTTSYPIFWFLLPEGPERDALRLKQETPQD